MMHFQTLSNFCSLFFLPKKQKGFKYLCWESDFCSRFLFQLPLNIFLMTTFVLNIIIGVQVEEI